MSKLVEECRPLLEDWARLYSVEIQWFHEWEHAGARKVTAFGYDRGGEPRHHTVSLPKEYHQLRERRCRDCADSDGFCCNDKEGRNCGFEAGHPLYRAARFRPAPADVACPHVVTSFSDLDLMYKCEACGALSERQFPR